MSLFRRPKKPMQRRVFGADDDDSADDASREQATNDAMDVDVVPVVKERRSEKKSSKDAGRSNKQTSLLSFGDEGRLASLPYSSL